MGGRVKTSFFPVLSIACASVYVTDNVNDAIDHMEWMVCPISSFKESYIVSYMV